MSSEQILFLDDDVVTAGAFATHLLAQGYNVDVMGDYETACARLRTGAYAVVVVNEELSAMDGLSLIDELERLQPDACFTLATSRRSLELVQRAINDHAVEYVVNKPYNLSELSLILNRGLESHWEKTTRRRFEESALETSDAVQAQKKRLETAVETAVETLSEALVRALKDRGHETEAHVRRTAACTMLIADALDVDEPTKRAYYHGALLHDVGKITVPDSILLKEGKLTDSEWALVRMHPRVGADLLGGFPQLEGAGRLVAQHHERWDGSGYPEGLKGNAIDLGARIFAIADTLDAMLSPRPYHPVSSLAQAYTEIREGAGKLFDPECVAALLSIPPARVLEVYRRFPPTQDWGAAPAA